jgi:hypothetical protein
LYINHAFIKCTELVPELERAVNFLKKSPKEVVVLNFHQFPYPSDFLISHHLEVLDVIATIFGELIYPLPRLMHRRGPKLKEFWQSGKRVIVSYRNANVVRGTRVPSLLRPKCLTLAFRNVVVVAPGEEGLGQHSATGPVGTLHQN